MTTPDHQSPLIQGHLLNVEGTMIATEPRAGSSRGYTGHTVNNPLVFTHYTNPEDEGKVVIGTITAETNDTSVHITVPALNEGVTHCIENLTLYGSNNTIHLNPNHSSFIRSLTLGEGSSYHNAYGTGQAATIRQHSRMTNVRLDSPCGYIEVIEHSSLSNVQFHPDSQNGYHRIASSTICGRRELPVVIRHGFMREQNVSLAPLSFSQVLELQNKGVDSLTLDKFNIQLKLRNIEGYLIRVQQFSRDNQCWIQLGCWLGTLEETRELIQGPTTNWPAFEATRDQATQLNLPLSTIIDEARDRYRAVLDLVKANHQSVTTGTHA